MFRCIRQNINQNTKYIATEKAYQCSHLRTRKEDVLIKACIEDI